MTSTDATTSNVAFADPVLPLLPGPVDMRTYNSTTDVQPSSHGYVNHLLHPFGNISVDQSLPEEEDLDKSVFEKQQQQQQQQLQQQLQQQPQQQHQQEQQQVEPHVKIESNEGPTGPEELAANADVGKMALSDSRNQLKVKIKGPFLDANYVPAAVTPTMAQQAPSVITPTSASAASGTSNLRRMRKKELLWQYCSQVCLDMIR